MATANITSMGIGSGIDLSGLLTQLTDAERKSKLEPIQKQQVKVQTSLSAFGVLKGAVAGFKSSITNLSNSATFDARTTLSSDSSVLTVSATNKSSPASFSAEVISLASNKKEVFSGVSKSLSTVTPLGEGSLTFTTAGKSFTLNVDSANNNLVGLADAINKAPNNSLVSANIINVDNGSGGTESRLVLTSKAAGTENAVTVTATDSDGDNTDAAGLSRFASSNALSTTAASDAVVKIDGQTLTRSTNTITDAVNGVTLNLQKAGTSNVSVDVDKLSGQKAIEGFVNAYNALAGTLSSLGKYDSTTGESGPLLADSTLRNITTQLRREMATATAGMSGGIEKLSQLGITTQKDGSLAFDVAKYSTAASENLAQVSEFFSKNDQTGKGLGLRLSEISNNFVKFQGTIYNKEESLQKTFQSLLTNQGAIEKRLTSYETQLKTQFGNLDSLIAGIKGAESFISNQLTQFNNSQSN